MSSEDPGERRTKVVGRRVPSRGGNPIDDTPLESRPPTLADLVVLCRRLNCAARESDLAPGHPAGFEFRARLLGRND